MFEIAYTQHRGKKNNHQQDALWNGSEAIQGIDIPSNTKTIIDKTLLLAVADGVAISPYPDIASLFVIKALGASAGVEEPLTPRRIRKIHGLLCDRYAKGRTRGSSTTVVAARCIGDDCDVVNVGDSRAYRISIDGQWQQLSHDHTILNDLIASGEAEPDQEYASLYQGLAHCLVADGEEDGFSVYFRQSKILPGENLLLCSDGLHDVLNDELLSEMYKTSASPLEQVNIWRNAVMEAGAPDNFSIVLARRLQD